MSNEILFIDDLSRELGISVTCINSQLRRVRQGKASAIPPAWKFGRRWAWFRADVQTWYAAKLQSREADHGAA